MKERPLAEYNCASFTLSMPLPILPLSPTLRFCFSGKMESSSPEWSWADGFCYERKGAETAETLFFAEMRPQSPVFGGGRRRRFCELRIPLLSGKSSLIRLFTSSETSSANSTDGRSSSPHRHHVLHGHTCHSSLRRSVLSI